MDITKTKSYEEFYYKVLSFDDFGKLKGYLKQKYWYYQNSPQEIREQIERIYNRLKIEEKEKINQEINRK